MTLRYAALNRFGLGARPGEEGSLDDPRGWLEAQLTGAPPSLEAPVPDADHLVSLIRDYLRAVRARDQSAAREVRRALGRTGMQEAQAVLKTRTVTERPFMERWIGFWSNHLCVSAAAGVQVVTFAGPYEREVIRRHALGRFEEMLLASARHPAMLLYLNNAQSVGPSSRLARRPRRGGDGGDRLRGLNENYARELLELHTVGVEGGYTQDDVVALARILTGWTVAGLGGPLDRVARPGRGVGRGGRGPGTERVRRREGAPGGVMPEVGFHFLPMAHDPGRKTVLGRRYGEGREAGEAVMRDLARNPATARFLAQKLARHFVSDEPPAAVVDALARRWLDTEGDLREVARTLVRLDAAWAPEHRKFRTPQGWLVAVLRAVHAQDVPQAAVGILRQLRHPLWAPPSPAGFSDLERDWGDPDSLMNRAELARTVADRMVGGRRREDGGRPGTVEGRAAQVRTGRPDLNSGAGPDPRFLATVMEVPAGDPLPDLLSDESIPVNQRLALGFAGPAFQWR